MSFGFPRESIEKRFRHLSRCSDSKLFNTSIILLLKFSRTKERCVCVKVRGEAKFMDSPRGLTDFWFVARRLPTIGNLEVCKCFRFTCFSLHVMLHTLHICVRSKKMSIGSSGRIVIEIDPDLKKKLYSILVQDGMSLKSWFLNEANLYLSSHQGSEKIVAETSVECLK